MEGTKKGMLDRGVIDNMVYDMANGEVEHLKPIPNRQDFGL